MIQQNATEQPQTAVALGLFDGVHLGHRAVLAAAVACQKDGLSPVAFTMQTTSVQMKHGEPLCYLYPDAVKQQLLLQSGMTAVVSPTFAEIAEMDGETFCRTYLHDKMHARNVFCGADFRFGKGAAWNVVDLQAFGRQFGFTVSVVEAVRQNDCVISSSIIRQLLQSGDVEQAAQLLGAPYQLVGTVQHGAALGRQLQFPTINLPFAAGQLVPMYGVYRAKVVLQDGSVWDGVTNVGVKPTVSQENLPVAETHLLGYTGDLYHTHCQVQLLEFLRKEQKFSSLEQLKAAIASDIMAVEKKKENRKEVIPMEKRVRTRFAPSPTGYMHIGNLRTALYAYLLAKKYDGDFILRIEDTDQERYVEGAVDIIYNTLRIAGLKWDEGPDIGGPVGPYVQSERMGMFKGYAEQLVESGHAYYCFCDKERLEEVRKIQEASHIAPMYDRHCRDLSPEEVQAKLDAGVPYVIRQKMPLTGTTTFHDEVYGDITVENSTLDDQILIKTDGMPTYNFANVVDDHLMGITHVIRGNEYLSSAPKYNLLYQAFGWDVPVYIHCSPVMKDKTHKLSKRNGDASFQDLLEKGYLPEAIINFIALLGWAPTGEQEIYTLDELAQAFEISGISKSPALFDPVKLKAINGEYIRKMTPEAFAEKAIPYIRQTVQSETADLQLLCHVLQPRTELFTDIPEQVDFIDALPDYDVELYRHKKMKTTPETAKEALEAVLPVLESISDWTVDGIHAAIFAKIGEMGVKNGWMLWPLRTALSGKSFTPGGGIELCAILGKEATLARVQDGIQRLS